MKSRNLTSLQLR
jgi:hypothetical protein